MGENENEIVEREKTRRSRSKKLFILFLAVLVIGAGAGVGTNFIFAEPGVQKESEAAKEEKAGEKDDEEDPEEEKAGKRPAVPRFNTSQAMSHIFALSEQIGDRPAGSVRASGAADYIVRKMGEYGYTVEEQSFTTTEGFGSRNIIGNRRGTREGYTIIVGAHLDSPRGLKGAVDDASGVGVVLELARVFADERLRSTIQFVFFGANRPGVASIEERLVGSRQFVDMLGSMDKKEIIGMIAVDCVGQGELLALRTKETGLQRLKAKLATFARESGVETVSLKSTSDSENIPFEDAGIPAVWIEWCDAGGSLVTDNNYQSVVPGKVETVGVLIEDLLYDLTSDDLEELKY
ncbi:MAG: M28 family peptidase [Actinobacteria bacterium]|nr:M28 family peptidase [Actinomycetota bacterium]